MRALILCLLLAACASHDARPPIAGMEAPASLRIVSWNMEHLAERNGAGCRPREDGDYAAMRAFVETLNADVVAFQEVESVAAAARVFDPAEFVIVIEERGGSARQSQCNGLPGHFLTRQATGFAVRRSIPFTRAPDVAELSLGDPNLRSGVDIIVRPSGGEAPLRLLSVHLKSGCASGATAAACATLQQQAPVLEAWIDARASEDVAFIVLGDFNRRLANPEDPIWRDWDDATPANSDLTLAAQDRTPACDPRYREFIDHIVLDRRAASRAGGFREWTYAGANLSDHCPIGIEVS